MIPDPVTTVKRHPMRAVALLAVTSAMFACSSGSDTPKVPLGERAPADSTQPVAVGAHAIIGPRAKAALDSGNALYRKKEYAAALVHYREASELAPQHAAPFFGIYMVARATGKAAMADSALVDIRVRNGPLPPAPRSLHDSVLGRMHELAKKKATT
ncbi:MAG: tetratricopeptide repeat protein [Gemmatimonadaceae bacterium]